KRNPEIDHDAREDFGDRYVYHGALEAEKWRQHRDEEPGIEAKRNDLEQAVERYERRGILTVAARQLVPYKNHGDAAGDTHEDQSNHVFRIVVQEDNGKDEHKRRADQPV